MNKNWFLVMMFAGMVLLILFLYLQVRPGMACLSNPLEYGSSHMIDSRTNKVGDLMCSCNFEGSLFTLDNNGIKPLRQEYRSDTQVSFNLSLINLTRN